MDRCVLLNWFIDCFIHWNRNCMWYRGIYIYIYIYIKAYLHRFKMSETPTRPCGKTAQTTDHLLHECELLKTQKDNLRSTVPKSEGWPITKHTLISKYYNAFIRFTKEISYWQLTLIKELWPSNSAVCYNQGKWCKQEIVTSTGRRHLVLLQ
jgi:hypothetical protein